MEDAGDQDPLIEQEQRKNLGKKILKGLFYVLTFSIAVLALLMSTIQLSQSQSDKIPVKYPTYERIGNKGCPDIGGTSLIYSGVTISYSFYNNTPTSYAGFRCMPLDKEDINYYDTDQFRYGEEQVNSGNVTGYITFTTSNHHDAACAVCMVEGRGSIMVMPGTDKCLDSWTTEYNGYLMTGYTCVDIEMEGIGALKDPNREATLRHEVISSKVSQYYQDQNVLSCIVCSK